jgi:hypothetical protein
MQPQDPPSATSEQQPGDATEAESPGAASGGAFGSFRVQPVATELAAYGSLLVMIFTAFVIEGVATASNVTLTLLTVLLAGTTVLALYVAHARRPVVLAGAAVAAALVLLTFVEAVTGGVDVATVSVADFLLVAVGPPAILIGVIRRLKATRAVTVEAVIGVISVYLLIGMAFAFLYAAIDRLGSEPFFTQSVVATASRFQYYSFTTLATVGYGDLTASSNVGHTLSVFEALLGQVYLVTVVSLIVGNLGRRRAR